MAIDKQYWNNRYKTHQTSWDMGNISDPLKNYFDQLKNKNISILIPGCGNAHEAEYLIQNDFSNITLIDISELVVDSLKKKFEQYISEGKMKILCGDFFELDEQFDLIIEQTFFCALDPSLRKKYAEKMNTLLGDNGKLSGVLFSFPLTTEGPPFGGNKEEYQNYFATLFQIQTMEPCYNSIQPRQERELFFVLKKLQ
ncbi:MAG: methyltransferase [Bacteroidota bacterium]